MVDYPALDRLGGVIADRLGRLDILVGNAGILGGLRPTGHFPPDEWERVMAVNVTANWRLIRCFDALLRASDAGRATFVTSGAATMTISMCWVMCTQKSSPEKWSMGESRPKAMENRPR